MPSGTWTTIFATDQSRPRTDNAWLLGEDFQGNPIANIDRFKQTGIDALFDFPFYYALTNSICDTNLLKRLPVFSPWTLTIRTAATSYDFLDNHDLPRILSRCGDDKASVLLSEIRFSLVSEERQ